MVCAFALLFHVLDEGGDEAAARTTAGGPIVSRLGDKTEFGSPVTFSVS
ncbi:MAG TPA: hypothetical protein VGH14_09775 [Solirubrobacterales bacterium]